MFLLAVLPAVALAVQEPAVLPPSPIKRIEVQPAMRTITAGDSVKLVLRALDANGAPVPGAVLYVKMLGGGGEGSVRPESFWLVASSVGKFPLSVSALVPGSRPFVDSTSVEFLGVPGPATRLDVSPRTATIVTGQSLRLSGLRSPGPTIARSTRCAGSPARQRSPRWTGTASITGLATGRATSPPRSGGDGTLGVRVVPGEPRQARTHAVAALGAPGRRGAVRGGRARRGRQAGRGPHADLELLARRRPARRRRPRSWPTARRLHRHRDARPPRREHDRHVERARRAAVGDAWSAGCRGPRSRRREVWIHPNGKVAYLGTHMGGDRVYAIDITEPGEPGRSSTPSWRTPGS